MTTQRARLAAVALATVCLTMAFVPLASARQDIAPSAPRLESYDALLSAKGSLEIVFSSHKLRECSPGYDVTTKVLAKFDTGHPVQVTFSAMYAKKGKPPIFLSSATASGKSTTTGAFLDWRTSNYCPPTDPDPTPPFPVCNLLTGLTEVSVGSVPTDRDAIMLTVTRQGGGSQSPACFMYGYDGPHTGVFLATAMPYDGIAGIMLPTGLSGRKLIDWPTGKKITKVMRVSGNCDGMTINGVPGTPTNSDPDPEESCTVSGNVTMTFTPMK